MIIIMTIWERVSAVVNYITRSLLYTKFPATNTTRKMKKAKIDIDKMAFLFEVLMARVLAHKLLNYLTID